VNINIPIPSGALTSWKSSFIGVAGVFLAALQAHNAPTWSAAFHDHGFQMAILIGILGWVAKDSNVTGGTKGQPSSPSALADANQEPSKSKPPVPEVKKSAG
jgi:hypothetical protein